MLDRLRWVFPYAVAVLLPLAGIVLAAARLAEGEHDDGRRLTAATLLGVALYAFFVFS